MIRQETLGIEPQQTRQSGPVECLGMNFENDEARRAYFLAQLREQLQDPAFRAMEGFPRGSDEDILALSDPPYYTVCPNPFIDDFVKHYGTPYNPDEPYHKEPFAADVSEGKNDPIYNAHSYHTKVPHKAIMRYILHYTKPGDIVYDGFCGTGMTGVAAQLCSNREVVEGLGYKVQLDSTISDESGRITSKLGARRAVLSDLSPTATFIAYNYNSPVDPAGFELEARRVLGKVEQEYAWMYQTSHTDGRKGRINYTVWSEVFHCPNCSQEIVFLTEAFDRRTGQVRPEFQCPHCSVQVSKKNMSRVVESFFDTLNNITGKRVKRVPVIINYMIDGKKYEKNPDVEDFKLLQSIDSTPIADFFPLLQLPFMHISHIKDKMSNFGITHFSHFFLSRQQHTIAALWRTANECQSPRIKNALLFMVEQCIVGMSILNRYSPTHYSQANRFMSGVLYVPSQISEVSPWYVLIGKLNRLVKVFSLLEVSNKVVTSLNSGGAVLLPDCSIDYIFTDPPFGENLQYSELNWFVESFYKVLPDTKPEAVVNQAQQKQIKEYQELMFRCFSENYRVLKPGHWMTVEFHNSKNSIWNAIQEALLRAGFVIADVRMLDKQGETYKQSLQGVVKADLVISAYRPDNDLESSFSLEAGTEEGAWNFVRAHLRQLPVFVSRDGHAEAIAERQNYLLFDRMVAFHVQRGVTIPMSAADFYAGLQQRFPERDGMYFLPEQVVEYDKKRMTAREVQQLQVFVTGEASAIQWIRQQLLRKPQATADLTPQFMRELAGWNKYEMQLELLELLEQNFLRYDGKGEVPSQIHSYLSSNFKELRNLPKDHPALQAKAKDRWYVPDPNKASDLERLRDRGLLREFEEYRASKQKKLKVFRLEAVRAGFKRAWGEKDYQTIIGIAEKIPETVLQEDPKLLMWYDQALTRTGREV